MHRALPVSSLVATIHEPWRLSALPFSVYVSTVLHVPERLGYVRATPLRVLSSLRAVGLRRALRPNPALLVTGKTTASRPTKGNRAASHSVSHQSQKLLHIQGRKLHRTVVRAWPSCCMIRDRLLR